MQMHKKKFWDFKMKGSQVGELFLYGDIASSTWWGDEVTPKQFKEDLDALGDIDELRVYINSGGGDVFAGWNIINILARHKARKIGYNDGLAGSIAFCILMSLDEVVAMENSMFMTHNCWTITMGNRHELRDQADQMEKIDRMLSEATAKRSGKTPEEVMAIQDAESWFSAAEALQEGFADKIQEGMKLAASIDGGFLVCGKERFPVERYKNMPKLPEAMYTERENAEEPLPEVTIGEQSEPCNGGESEPVEDKSQTPGALAEQRNHFNRIKRKLLGGNDDGEHS